MNPIQRLSSNQVNKVLQLLPYIENPDKGGAALKLLVDVLHWIDNHPSEMEGWSLEETVQRALEIVKNDKDLEE